MGGKLSCCPKQHEETKEDIQQLISLAGKSPRGRRISSSIKNNIDISKVNNHILDFYSKEPRQPPSTSTSSGRVGVPVPSTCSSGTTGVATRKTKTKTQKNYIKVANTPLNSTASSCISSTEADENKDEVVLAEDEKIQNDGSNVTLVTLLNTPEADHDNMIIGDDDTAEWLKNEEEIIRKWGTNSVYFNVFRMDRSVSDVANSQQRLYPMHPPERETMMMDEARDKIMIQDTSIPKQTTVADVKRLLRDKLLPEHDIQIAPHDQLTFYVDFVMEDHLFFWEDHELVLPLFVTVWVHDCNLEELREFMLEKMLRQQLEMAAHTDGDGDDND